MPQVSKGYSLDHAYKMYKQSVAKKAQKFKISKKEYKDICKAYISKIVEMILIEGKEIVLPYGLGYLWIRRSQTIPDFGFTEEAKKRLKINWKETNHLWKDSPELRGKQFIYHLNEHSDGWYAVWHWSKFKIRIKGQRSYTFEPSWSNARELSKLMQQPKFYQRYLVNY